MGLRSCAKMKRFKRICIYVFSETKYSEQYNRDRRKWYLELALRVIKLICSGVALICMKQINTQWYSIGFQTLEKQHKLKEPIKLLQLNWHVGGAAIDLHYFRVSIWQNLRLLHCGEPIRNEFFSSLYGLSLQMVDNIYLTSFISRYFRYYKTKSNVNNCLVSLYLHTPHTDLKLRENGIQKYKNVSCMFWRK